MKLSDDPIKKQKSLSNLNRNGNLGKEVNLEGQKFNKLTVIKKGRRVRQSTFEYECICECGSLVIVQSRGDNISKKSCRQCIDKSIFRNKTKPKEFVDMFSTLRHRYRKNAIDRGYAFNLNREQFEKIIQEPWYYCGSHKQSKQMYNKRGLVYYTGIDRVDNSKGYNLDNCVPCCKVCNTHKMAVTKNIIEKAYKFLFGIKDE